MFIYEFVDFDTTNSAELVSLTAQLKQSLEDGEIGDNFTVDELLDYFQNYDIILDIHDLYNMIKEPPLNTLIKNIEGDRVEFVDENEPENDEFAKDQEDKKNTVKQMADRATKKSEYKPMHRTMHKSPH